ncbi:hypothetical protein A225_2062 [Klebsiella michiganensis E718]|nr:hypothetical protein A225_2062 [Klebsiella michiganensis E718]
MRPPKRAHFYSPPLITPRRYQALRTPFALHGIIALNESL